MTATRETEAFEEWLRTHNGFYHANVHLRHDEDSGYHLRTTAPLPPETLTVSTPHSLALSYLNALVDDAFPVFKQQKHRFKVEAIGFFYLMAQYINREQSFWKPYLDTLPCPYQELTEALFFEHEEDVAWLEDTDVWRTVCARAQVYEMYHRDGIEVLREAGIDTQPYTWHLFKWAATIYASRSFSSRSLRPTSNKYWAAYKSRPSDGTRQAVLLDMCHASAEDLHFPVLFPGLDAANHSPDAKVDWTFDPGRFTINLSTESEGLQAGDEFFNNYGAKGNGELLIGYGFCIPDNPHDTVGMTLKAPPTSLQSKLHSTHPGYFTNEGNWNPKKATFYLKRPHTTPQTTSGLSQRPQIFHQLPEALLELLLYILRDERGLEFKSYARPLHHLTDLESDGRRYLPHIARMIVQSLAPKLPKLQLTSSTLPSEPKSKKQRLASIYRQGQNDILTSLISALRTYTRSLIYNPTAGIPRGPSLVTLESFIHLLTSQTLLPESFLTGIEANANTRDLEQLRLADWEEDVWVLLLCYLHLQLDRLPVWLREALTPEYVEPISAATATASEQAESVMDIVSVAAEARGDDSLWRNQSWTPEFVARTGGSMLQFEAFMVMVPSGGEGGAEEARLCLYLHFA
ncbi:hypothetical protein LTR37_009858 [Vermiconidia calcicola]|uniref:Uncharacterized protein n=1 Tax=Vermiconidia calcicola TaxID=1690605 RepID=A0ACC3N6B3_9PEZI|nr:hypothetical protein LTR37_009858 [Vermiconidia calcicola]